MAARDFFLGTPARTEQVQRFGPEQQQAFSQILQQALSGLQNPQAGFEPIAQQARTQFEQQTVPGLAERFTGLDGQRSSAFAQTLGQAGAGLEQGLAAQGAQFGQQQQGLLQQLLGQGLQPQFDPIRIEQDPGLIRQGTTAFSQGLGQALPGLLSGGLGGLGGAAGGIKDLISKLMQLLQGGGGQQQAQGAQRAPQQFGGISGLPKNNLGGGTAANLGLLTGGF